VDEQGARQASFEESLFSQVAREVESRSTKSRGAAARKMSFMRHPIFTFDHKAAPWQLL